MSNEPPDSGASEPEPPEGPPTSQPPTQPSPPQQPPTAPPPRPSQGRPPPPPPPYAQPGPYGQPPQQPPPYGRPQQPNPYGPPPQQSNPYAQPQQPSPTQPVWQGHQAPQQQYPQQQGWSGQPPYGAASTKPKNRKALLIGLLVVLVLALVGAAIVVALMVNDSEGLAVEDISSGDCLVGSGLADAEEEITDIETVDCDDSHDAEVFATFELGSDQDLDAAGSQCVEEATKAGKPLTDLESDDLEIRPLVASDAPDEGDEVVCFIRHRDGDKLSAPEFE